ncbi:MAG TPA: recombinase family protein [Candidatus Paceibacterota bacterium]|nr:recombinase family protein [Candidatus Paceibacterota bacterium]
MKDKERNIIPDPEKSPFIIKIFEMYSSGNYSLLEIVEEMKKLGLVGNSGRNKPLTKSMIHVILNNPFYYGVMRIKNKIYSHKYKPLISKDLFSRCQSVLLGYHKKPFIYGAKPYMFRGLITCAECGCMITPETSKGHHYYHCTNYKRVHKKVLYIKEEDLLSSIYEFLDSISFEDEQIKEITECLKKTNQDKDQFHQLALSNLHKEYDQIDKRISASFNLLADGKVPQDVFDAKLKE